MREEDSIEKGMVYHILSYLGDKSSNVEVLILLNDLGSTPLMELYLIYNTNEKLLKSQGVFIARLLVGNYTNTYLYVRYCNYSLIVI